MDSELPKDVKRGFKVKIKRNSYSSVLKVPLFCPREECRQITSNLDDFYLREMGICQSCFILLVENRVTPLIDVMFYKNRLKERGY